MRDGRLCVTSRLTTVGGSARAPCSPPSTPSRANIPDVNITFSGLAAAARCRGAQRRRPTGCVEWQRSNSPGSPSRPAIRSSSSTSPRPRQRCSPTRTPTASEAAVRFPRRLRARCRVLATARTSPWSRPAPAPASSCVSSAYRFDAQLDDMATEPVLDELAWRHARRGHRHRRPHASHGRDELDERSLRRRRRRQQRVTVKSWQARPRGGALLPWAPPRRAARWRLRLAATTAACGSAADADRVGDFECRGGMAFMPLADRQQPGSRTSPASFSDHHPERPLDRPRSSPARRWLSFVVRARGAEAGSSGTFMLNGNSPRPSNWVRRTFAVRDLWARRSPATIIPDGAHRGRRGLPDRSVFSADVADAGHASMFDETGDAACTPKRNQSVPLLPLVLAGVEHRRRRASGRSRRHQRLDWRNVRGAFLVDGYLYTAHSNALTPATATSTRGSGTRRAAPLTSATCRRRPTPARPSSARARSSAARA